MVITIGIIYDVDENWIAGSYYIENLVSALRTLSGDKPKLKIYSRDRVQFENIKRKTGYPNISWAPLSDQNTIFDKIINKIFRLLFKKQLITRGIDTEVDILFPTSHTYLFDNIKNKLFWIPDFQEIYFPNFFSAQEIKRRELILKEIAANKQSLIVSSEHAKSDFYRLFPNAVNKVFVLPFAVSLPSLDGISFEMLLKKYNIKRDYFICSNQFWAHKNHSIVLSALSELKKQGLDPLVIFTGKPHDPRNPDYYSELIRQVEESNLVSNTQFLGFIDRIDQLVLMKNSIAVIQPSLFEGWSTVVEDSKALGKTVIVSDIPVHREQLGDGYKFYFDKDDPIDLATVLKNFTMTTQPDAPAYNINVSKFGEEFINIVLQIV